MSVAILVPVLDRPHRIEPLLDNIEATTPEDVQVVFATSDNATINECNRLGAWQSIDDGDTWPNRINRLFRETDDPFVFLCADDVTFHPGWLPPLLAAQDDILLEHFYAPFGGVTVPNDLHNPRGTLALVARSYIDERSGCMDEPGVVVHSGYAHNWADTELFETAKHRNRFRYVTESVVEHLHPCAGKGVEDPTYAKGFASFHSDQAIFRSRRHLWT